MEHHLQTIAVGIGQDVFVELHRLLFVTAQEVDLDAGYALLLQPRHLAVAGQRGVHAVARGLRGIVGIAVRVVP